MDRRLGQYVWNEQKAALNLKNHRVSFFEAIEAIEDPYAMHVADLDHGGEVRLNVIGHSSRRLLFVVCVERGSGDTLRIVSARRATPEEREEYEHG